MNNHSLKLPKLRFASFSDILIKKSLCEIAQIYDGTHMTPNYVESGIPFFSVEQVTADNFNNTKYISEEVFEKENKRVKLEKGDILMTRIGNIGTSKLINWEVKASFYVSLSLIKVKSGNNSEYINHYISTENFQKELWNRTIHVAFPKKINLGEIGNCELILPSLDEQAKIAPFVTSVETKIQQLIKKKALLEQYKKGVRQKIYNQEIQFKDENGKNYPEWEVSNLGNVSEITMGQSPNSSSYNTKGIGMPLIQGNADIMDRKTNPRNWTSEPTKVCKVGDLILTVRAPVGAVAKSLHDACIGRGVCAIRNNKKTDLEFLYQFLLDYELKWGSIEQGSTFTAVSGSEIRKLEIKVPTIKEQTKIANFLTALDFKIEHINTQIEKTKLWKKGLLQQLFV